MKYYILQTAYASGVCAHSVASSHPTREHAMNALKCSELEPYTLKAGEKCRPSLRVCAHNRLPQWALRELPTATSELSELTLTEEQTLRVIEAAASDAKHWAKEAKDGTLPDVETMNLDWWIDADLIEAGVTEEIMQRISFRIAETN